MERVTKAELLELADWEAKYAEASKALAEAEKQLKPRRLALAVKVLGVESADELKLLEPEQLEKLLEKREKKGLFKVERGAPGFNFVKTSEGRYPAWKQLYISELGEAAADKIAAETPKIFSYRIEVT